MITIQVPEAALRHIVEEAHYCYNRHKVETEPIERSRLLCEYGAMMRAAALIVSRDGYHSTSYVDTCWLIKDMLANGNSATSITGALIDRLSAEQALA